MKDHGHFPRNPAWHPVRDEVMGDHDMSVGSPADRAHEMELKVVEFLRISDEPLPNFAADRIEMLERRLAEIEDHPLARLQVGPDGHVPGNTVEALVAWHAEARRLDAHWQPIETAPKDGEPILLYSKYDGIGLAVRRRNRWHWWANGSAIDYMSDFGTEYKTFDVPTHWMPLPNPPVLK